jgi:hypothetical protein
MATNVDLQEHLPESLTTDDVHLIRSRCHFLNWQDLTLSQTCTMDFHHVR